MFTKIKNWLLGVEHDIEAIIENFTSTVTKLEAAAEAKARETAKHFADAYASNVLAAEADAAGRKAASVAAKIKALVA